MSSAPTTAIRIKGLVRLAVGVGLIGGSDRLVRAVQGGPPPELAGGAARVLGVREIGQGVALLAVPTAGVVTLGAVVDALHASSMVGLALWKPRYRRLALVSAAFAATGALTGAALARDAE